MSDKQLNGKNIVFNEEECEAVKLICERLNFRQFTTEDIKQFRRDLSTVIIAPYNENQVKGVGYNLTASNMVYSLSKHRLLKIKDSNNGKFFYLSAHDTALILTNEYFKVDNNVAGNFYSRVRRVSEGLGQISTTLDPNWKGMFLIALNNNANKKIKVQISSKTEGQETKIGIATVVLTGIKGYNNHDSFDEKINLDNPAMRIDILKELVDDERIVIRKYEHNTFKQLVESLDNFEAKVTGTYTHINKIKSDLENIDNALMYENNAIKVKTYINSLNWFVFDGNEELKRKIQHLQIYLDENNYDIINSNKKGVIKSEVDTLKKECDYILLCENVNQIHNLIDKHIEKYHKYSFINSIIDWIWKNKFVILLFLVAFISTIILIVTLINLENQNTNPDDTVWLILTAILTALISGFTAKLFKW